MPNERVEEFGQLLSEVLDGGGWIRVQEGPYTIFEKCPASYVGVSMQQVAFGTTMFAFRGGVDKDDLQRGYIRAQDGTTISCKG